jgi:hypothetical protein
MGFGFMKNLQRVVVGKEKSLFQQTVAGFCFRSERFLQKKERLWCLVQTNNQTILFVLAGLKAACERRSSFFAKLRSRAFFYARIVAESDSIDLTDSTTLQKALSLSQAFIKSLGTCITNLVIQATFDTGQQTISHRIGTAVTFGFAGFGVIACLDTGLVTIRSRVLERCAVFFADIGARSFAETLTIADLKLV